MNKKIILALASLLIIGNLNLYAKVATPTISQCPANNPYHILINKQNRLSPNYKPSNLVIPNVTFQSPGNIEKNYMEATAAKALEEMFVAAKSQNIRLVAISGYRSYSRQSTLYKNALSTYGNNQIGTARPGESEHQSGLAMDLNSISQSFQYTKEGKWLAQNAHYYGFIIRYPKGKSHITGYMYEPWHVRYVGKELATYCYTNNLTLEELENCCVQDKLVDMKLRTSQQTEAQTYQFLKRNGITYIKSRDLVATIGGSVTFDKGKLTLFTNAQILTLTENSVEAFLNDTPITLTYSPLVVNQTFYLPIRTILASLGFHLNFIDSSTLFIS